MSIRLSGVDIVVLSLSVALGVGLMWLVAQVLDIPTMFVLVAIAPAGIIGTIASLAIRDYVPLRLAPRAALTALLVAYQLLWLVTLTFWRFSKPAGFLMGGVATTGAIVGVVWIVREIRATHHAGQ